LLRAGKRWRPFLVVAAFQALRPDPGAPFPEDLKKIAVAVECFHKASLVHDDIEDNDAWRYGEQTLHESHGLPIALNVGDLLIGEGYRLIGDSIASPEQKAAMLTVAAQGQRQLCRGQGTELHWARQPVPLTSPQVLGIFRGKTAPAFEVALRLGALHAGVDQHEGVSAVLAAYSEALGIAYQVRDDLSDLGEHGETDDIAGQRPSLVLAVAHERSAGEKRALLQAVWRRATPGGITPADIEKTCVELRAVARAEQLLETYKEEAVRALAGLENPNLKGLLRRVIGKIFNDVEIKGWCKEVEQTRENQTASAA
jgi:geranylgeranyl pyrophosphate synthase